MMRPRGRIVDGPDFAMGELVGNIAEMVVGYRCDSTDGEIIDIIGMKFAGIDYWHRFFLDAGCGFWEEWTAEEVFYDFDDCDRVDLATRWGLQGSRIVDARCKRDPATPTPSECTWTFEHGDLVLMYLDDNVEEEVTIVRFRTKPTTR